MSYADLLNAEAHRQAREERNQRIHRHWTLYDGHHPKPLKVLPAKGQRPAVDDNVTPNLLGMFVDKGVSWLMGEPPKFSMPTPDDDEAHELEGGVEVDPHEQYLDRVWKFNRAKTFLQGLAMNGGVAGDWYARIVVPAVPIIDRITGEPLVRIVNVDPLNVDVLFDQDDISRELAFLLEWTIVDTDGRPAVRRQTIELDDGDQSWTITDTISRGNDSEFVPYGGDAGHGAGITPWPWPFPPMVHGQNLPRPNEYHGASDLDGGIDHLNASLSRLLSNLSRIVRFHAHPKTWASGIGTQELANLIVDPEGIIGLPHPDAALHNLEMESDLSGALALYGKVKSLLHELGHVPDLSTEKLEGIGAMSGLALRILYGPLTELTSKKHGTYGDGLEELNRRILAVSGLEEYDPTLDVAVSWTDAVPADQLQQVQVAEAKKSLGVSEHTLLEELGYDPEEEAERTKGEQAASVESMRGAFDGGGFAGDGGGTPVDDEAGAGTPA